MLYLCLNPMIKSTVYLRFSRSNKTAINAWHTPQSVHSETIYMFGAQHEMFSLNPASRQKQLLMAMEGITKR